MTKKFFTTVHTTQFQSLNLIQITTTHSKKIINIKYNYRMIEQHKINTTIGLDFL